MNDSYEVVATVYRFTHKCGHQVDVTKLIPVRRTELTALRRIGKRIKELPCEECANKEVKDLILDIDEADDLRE